VIGAVVVVPGAPALVPPLMGAAAPDLEPARSAALELLRSALSAFDSPPHVVVAGPPDGGGVDPGLGRPGRWAGPVSAADFGRAVVLEALPGASEGPADPDVPTALLGARWLLGEVAREHPGAARWADLVWLPVTPDSPAAVPGEGRVLLVVAADGAASHGPKAPRAEHPGAASYDDELAAALAAGDPDRLTSTDVDLGTEVGALGPWTWPWLGRVTAGRRWDAQVAWTGHPFGIGYVVASWIVA
jgi:hypothetical protein